MSAFMNPDTDQYGFWMYTCSTLDLWLGLQSILHNTGNVKREFQAKFAMCHSQTSDVLI